MTLKGVVMTAGLTNPAVKPAYYHGNKFCGTPREKFVMSKTTYDNLSPLLMFGGAVHDEVIAIAEHELSKCIKCKSE